MNANKGRIANKGGWMGRKIAGLVVIAFFLMPAIARTEDAEAPAQPPATPQDVHQAMQQVGPAMTEMITTTLDGLLAYMTRPETTDQMAVFVRNYYDALIKKGFTEEQALQIATSANPLRR